MRQLRIGFDAKRVFYNETGLGNYSRSLLRRLAQDQPEWELHLFTPQKGKTPLRAERMGGDFQLHLGPKRGGAAWRSVGVSREISRLKLDIYHGLSHELPRGIGLTGAVPVVSMHDVIFRHFPDHYPLLDRLLYDRKWRHACKEAEKIVAISEATRDDLIRFYEVPAEKIQVIYQSVADHYWQNLTAEAEEALVRAYNLPAQYLLFVGSLTARKNLLGLIKALAIIPRDQCPHLVVVGQGATYRKQMGAFIHRQGLDKHIQFLTDTPHAALPALYRRAYALVYPSVYEGFGLPIVEALTMGTPVITSNISAMPEAAGPGALLTDPYDPESIAAAISRLGAEPELHHQLGTEGHAYVQRFRPERVGKTWSDFYQSLV